MAKKRTIFQTLDSVISGNWSLPQEPEAHVNSYDMTNMPNKVLYKTDNKEDYERKKLELKQSRYLRDKWVKVNQDLTVQAFNGINQLKLMYNEADLMDAMPEIGAALDTYADEASLPASDGNVIQVYSKSSRVKSILEDLFVNRLNVQVTSQMIIRGMCKYGNQFMILDVDEKQGVKGWKQLPVFEVERLENGVQSPYGGLPLAAQQNEGDTSTQFIWTNATVGGGTETHFRNWQVAHFRLLNNSMYLPYGCLVGDTMIETEHGFKEMSKIKVGDKVWTFNTATQERELGEVTVFMPKGVKEVYRLHTKHFEMEGTIDHKVLVADKNGFVYKEIQNLSTDDVLVCYSSDEKMPINVQIPKHDLTINEHGKKSLQWWTEYIDNVPDVVTKDFARFFGFMLGDGWLSHGYHVMFALGEHPSVNERYIKLLEQFTGKKSSFVPNKATGKRKLPFHTCFSGSKMLYIILKRLGFDGNATTKRVPEWVYNCSSEVREAFLDGFADADASCNVVSKKSMAYTVELANEALIKDLKTLARSLGYRTNKIGHRSRIGRTSFIDEKDRIITRHDSFYFSYYKEKLIQTKNQDIKYRNTDNFVCERVTKIDFVGCKETYDFTVNNTNSNFFANGIVTHNCSILNSARRHWRMLSLMEDMMLIYRLERSMERRVYKIFVGGIDDADVQGYVETVANNFKRTPIIDPLTGQVDLRKNILCWDQDIFIPTRDPAAPNPIDTLSAGQNLTAMDDIKYVQNKVLTALRVPKSFLNFEEAAGEGKNLALMDVRFTRMVNRVQQAFLMEMTKVATIHLYLMGFEDDLTNFTLAMNNPSTQAEQLEVEVLQKKIDVVRDAVSDPGNGLQVMSLQRALKDVLKWSEKDIKTNLEEIRLEKAIAAELEKTQQIIKKTGIFDTVDRIYGEPGAQYADEQQGAEGAGGGPDGGMPPMGGGGGGATDFGEAMDGMDNAGGDMSGDINGIEGSEPTADMGGGAEPPMENASVKLDGMLVNESKAFNTLMEKLNDSTPNSTDTKHIRAEVYDKAFVLNEEIDKMLKSLDEFGK